MFVTFDLQMAFHTCCAGMIVPHLHTNFHLPSSKSSIIIAIKLKAEVHFSISVILFQMLQNVLLIKVTMYILKVSYHMPF
jgi:fucose permease